MHHPLALSRPRHSSRLALLTAVLAVVAALVVASVGTPTEATGRDRPFPIDLERASIPQLRDALNARRITSEELVEAYLERIRALNSNGPGLNAVRVLTRDSVEQARQADQDRKKGRARGPMHGIPVLVKDNIDVKGLPTTAGALALADSYPSKDAFLVTRLRAAGAIILGKTNLTEFANFTTNGMPSGYSGLGGQVLNPYDVSQTPSGSSSGSGSAAAAALAAVTIGTETSGSILSPAAANSLVGVKPTVGLVSRTGIIPIAASQDTAGPMTRSVYDAAALLTALTGIDPEDPITSTSSGVVGTDYTRALSTTALQGKRIGVASTPTGNQGVLFNEALDVLRAQGATVVPVTVTTGGLPPGILDYEFKRDLNAYLARLPHSAPMNTLDDVVQFNLAHAAEGTIKFGQTQLVTSNNIDLTDPVGQGGVRDQPGHRHRRRAGPDRLGAAGADPGRDRLRRQRLGRHRRPRAVPVGRGADRVRPGERSPGRAVLPGHRLHRGLAARARVRLRAGVAEVAPAVPGEPVPVPVQLPGTSRHHLRPLTTAVPRLTPAPPTSPQDVRGAGSASPGDTRFAHFL